jgi:phosphatidylinositol 4-kinase
VDDPEQGVGGVIPTGGVGGLRQSTLLASAVVKRACIFKVYDDCRQDMMALQVMRLFQDTFQPTNLGIYLYPYKVIASRAGKDMAVGGIIECIPDVHSLDELGKDGHKSLSHYFRHKFGAPDSIPYETARRNLVRSLAGYAIVCFILWIKDRHNGNIMVDKDGHLVHIDFGFLLGISPGGNLGFETAAFKLTREMVDIMGGHVEAEMFRYFQELCCRAFLAARDDADGVLSTVDAMADSGLPCYLFPETLQKLRNRFQPHASPQRASAFMSSTVLDAVNKLTTVVYDGIQKLQNNIHSEAWR